VVQGVVMVNIGNDEEKLEGGDERRHDGEESKSDAVRAIAREIREKSFDPSKRRHD